MKRFSMFSIAGWFILTGIILAQQVEFLHPKVIDMGKILQGEEIKGALRFVNTGEGDLEISNIKPSCGCTAVTPEKLVYSSGDTANIPFTINTKNFRGVIRKNIRVSFKNIEPKDWVFVIQANVVSEISINPNFINFQRATFNPDTVLTEFFEIENESSKEVEIKKIYTNNKSIKVFPESVNIPPGKAHLIRLEFVPNQAGHQNAKIIIESNHRTQSQMDIPVFINVKRSS